MRRPPPAPPGNETLFYLHSDLHTTHFNIVSLFQLEKSCQRNPILRQLEGGTKIVEYSKGRATKVEERNRLGFFKLYILSHKIIIKCMVLDLKIKILQGVHLKLRFIICLLESFFVC